MFPPINGADGSLTANYSGTSSTTATVKLSPSVSQTINITIESEDDRGFTISSSDPWADTIKGPVNTAVGVLTGTTTSFSINGSVGFDWKNVDKYNDGDNIGAYWSGNGTLSGSFGGFEVEGLPIPLAPGISFSPKAGMDGLTLALTVSGTYDESKASTGSIEVSGSASSTAFVGGDVNLGAGKALCASFELTGGSTLGIEISGPGSNFPDKIQGSGELTADGLVVGYSFKVEAVGLSCTLYSGEHSFGSEVSISIPTFTLLDNT